MKSSYTHVSLVLDRSGSMSSIATDTIGGFNQLIADQKKVAGECSVTLVQFDSQQIETVFDAKPVYEVPLLSSANYQPRGCTPLYDAIGQAIAATGKFLKDKPESERPAKVVFVILTDGLENASREFTREAVFALIKQQREQYRWEFVFIGANQDALATGQGIGIQPANCLNMAANSVGTQAVYSSASSNLRRMREAPVGSASATMSFSTEQRDEQAKAGAQK